MPSSPGPAGTFAELSEEAIRGPAGTQGERHRRSRASSTQEERPRATDEELTPGADLARPLPSQLVAAVELPPPPVETLQSGLTDLEQPAGTAPVEPSPPPATHHGPPRGRAAEARVRALVKQALGAPYKPGGTTLEEGLSPGGFVHWLFGELGIVVPRTPEDQMVMVGEPLDIRSYRPMVGDLVFFDIQGLRHVGIVYDGEHGTFATVVPGRGGVVLASLADDFFAEKLVSARRVLR